jgi:hypothetical protein
MTARTYDPFALDKPTFTLGEHGEWTLADVTKANAAKIDALLKAFHEVAADPETDVPRVAAAVGEFIEAACENSDGLRDLIVRLTDEEALGVIALRGAVEFVIDWIYGESSAGEG